MQSAPPKPGVLLVARRGSVLLARAELSLGECTVGGPGADVVIPDPSLSAPHAKLLIESGRVIVEDLGREAGTYVDNVRVTGRVPVLPTQTIRLGSDVLVEAARIEPVSGLATAMARLLPKTDRDEPYDVSRVVGTGGMGLVMEARERVLQRTVAMKVVKMGASEEAMARFLEEARLTGQLEHPNIVPIHHFGVNEDEQPFYTMKFVHGVTLQTILGQLRHGEKPALERYPLTELLSIFQRVCDAIAFAHSRNIIHRDIKPGNVMLGEYGEVLVMDWGLATHAGTAPSGASGSGPKTPPSNQRPGDLRTQDGALVGTPNYMSPEQARGERATIASDIYALGALLYALLHWQPPITGDVVEEVLENVRQGLIEEAPVGHRLGTGNWLPPASLDAVARKAMARHPASRYATVADLQAEIRAYLSGFATEAEKASPLRLLWLALGRYRREAAIAAAALIALVGGGIFAFVHVESARKSAATALEDLRETAPAFYAQAQALVLEERYGEAVAKLDYALKLRPDHTEYALKRADLLFADMQFAAAARAYRELPKVERAARSAHLCEAVAAAQLDGSPPPKDLLAACYRQMREEQRPFAELLPIARLLGEGGRIARENCLERLRHLPIDPTLPLADRLKLEADGSLSLNLSSSGIVDLQPLAGMPFARLDLSGCAQLKNLEPLRQMPLRHLDLSGTAVTELAPLASSQLESLSIAQTPVSDLLPLRNLPLHYLNCTGTPVEDLLPLAKLPLHTLILDGTRPGNLGALVGTPLRALSLAGCSNVWNLQSLASIRDLESLVLPKDFFQSSARELEGILTLRGLRNIQRISAKDADGSRPESAGSAQIFWNYWEPNLRWIIAIKRQDFRVSLYQRPDGRWEVDLRDQAIAELDALKDAPIVRLCLFNTKVADIDPLRGMKLEELDIRLTQVSKIGVVANMPLRRLLLWRTPVSDFSPLKTLDQLELLDVSETSFSDLALLRTTRLIELRMGGTQVRDFGPLAGSGIEKIHADNVPVTDARPLLQCQRLKWFVPPRENFDPSPLRTLRSLERISHDWGDESVPTKTHAEFFREYDAMHPATAPE